MNQKGYRIIKPGYVLVDHGPITMAISASAQGSPLTDAAIMGAEEALRLLGELAKDMAIAKQPIRSLPLDKDNEYPQILQRMVKAVRTLQEDDFTPMAAVAGTFSDLVLEKVVAAGADRASVNNGGDIALYLNEGTMRVGIVQDLAQGTVTHVIPVQAGSGLYGIATSGFSGRSLTKGVASAVTILAERAALADAAATAVGNAANCQSPEVKRCSAQELDSLTDIYGHLVTKEIGHLTKENVQEALDNGYSRLIELRELGVAKGGVIFVQGEMRCWPQDLLQVFMNSV